MMNIQRISPEETFSLRTRLLDPNRTWRDGDETAIHYGAFIDGEVVGVASFFRQNQDEEIQNGHWRLRGMAVDELFQGKDIGRALVSTFLSNHQYQEIWCNARRGVEGFYVKLGFLPTYEFERKTGVWVTRMVLKSEDGFN